MGGTFRRVSDVVESFDRQQLVTFEYLLIWTLSRRNVVIVGDYRSRKTSVFCSGRDLGEGSWGKEQEVSNAD
jgi:hypothetical protein